MPVIVVTAKDAVEDRDRGLDVSAHDSLRKPFSLPDEASAEPPRTMRACWALRAGRVGRVQKSHVSDVEPTQDCSSGCSTSFATTGDDVPQTLEWISLVSP